MSKRRLESPSLPPAKRPHGLSDVKNPAPRVTGLDQVFYDEIILCIFSYLDWVDLCTTQSTSRNWARLAADNELWRNMYLNFFGRARLRGARGFVNRLDGREVKPLPGHSRAKEEQFKNWKWMFQISSNWRRGRCFIEPIGNAGLPAAGSEDSDQEIHILLAGVMTIAASCILARNPKIYLWNKSEQQHTLVYERNQSLPHAAITTVCLDQAPPSSHHVSLACFLSNGEFSIFRFNPNTPANAVKLFTHTPPRQARHTSRTVQAAYYYPLVVTLSEDFSLSIYDLSSDSIRQAQTMSSFTSYPPSSLVLSTPSPTTFKVVLAYSIPVYPNHWSAGASELIISKSSQQVILSASPLASVPAFSEDFRSQLPSSMSVITSRTIRAIDVPSGWIDDRRLQLMREQWARKVVSVADTQTDGKWLILAPGAYSGGITNSAQSLPPSLQTSHTHFHSSTGLQLYRLVFPHQLNSTAPSPPKLTFVRTLHGQTSPVSALALSDGRCVSLGCDGSIWVWDLENGTGAEVAPPDESPSPCNARGAVTFDERRIVTAHAGKFMVRRFDI